MRRYEVLYEYPNGRIGRLLLGPGRFWTLRGAKKCADFLNMMAVSNRGPGIFWAVVWDHKTGGVVK